MYIRPAQKLEGSTRYAVAVRKSLKAKDGSDLPVSEGFQSIVDGSDSGHPLLENLRRIKIFFAGLDGSPAEQHYKWLAYFPDSVRRRVLTESARRPYRGAGLEYIESLFSRANGDAISRALATDRENRQASKAAPAAGIR